MPARLWAQPLRIAEEVAPGGGIGVVVASDVLSVAVVGTAQVEAGSVLPGTIEVVSVVVVAIEAAPAGTGWRVRSSLLGSFVSLQADCRYRVRG